MDSAGKWKIERRWYVNGLWSRIFSTECVLGSDLDGRTGKKMEPRSGGKWRWKGGRGSLQKGDGMTVEQRFCRALGKKMAEGEEMAEWL